MDTDFGSWKSAEKTYNFMIAENSFILVNNFESDIVKVNKIKEIPRYLIIKNGRILEKNASKLSDIDFSKL